MVTQNRILDIRSGNTNEVIEIQGNRLSIGIDLLRGAIGDNRKIISIASISR